MMTLSNETLLVRIFKFFLIWINKIKSNKNILKHDKYL